MAGIRRMIGDALPARAKGWIVAGINGAHAGLVGARACASGAYEQLAVWIGGVSDFFSRGRDFLVHRPGIEPFGSWLIWLPVSAAIFVILEIDAQFKTLDKNSLESR